MKTVSITYAKNHLSSVIKMVREGTTVLLTDYGKPAARLEPAGNLSEDEREEMLNDLEKRGLIRIGSKSLPPDFWKKGPVKVKGNAGVLNALLDERNNGR